RVATSETRQARVKVPKYKSMNKSSESPINTLGKGQGVWGGGSVLGVLRGDRRPGGVGEVHARKVARRAPPGGAPARGASARTGLHTDRRGGAETRAEIASRPGVWRRVVPVHGGARRFGGRGYQVVR